MSVTFVEVNFLQSEWGVLLQREPATLSMAQKS
jgi:hypothetical protein